jgi:hypothetical protein
VSGFIFDGQQLAFHAMESITTWFQQKFASESASSIVIDQILLTQYLNSLLEFRRLVAPSFRLK